MLFSCHTSILMHLIQGTAPDAVHGTLAVLQTE